MQHVVNPTNCIIPPCTNNCMAFVTELIDYRIHFTSAYEYFDTAVTKSDRLSHQLWDGSGIIRNDRHEWDLRPRALSHYCHVCHLRCLIVQFYMCISNLVSGPSDGGACRLQLLTLQVPVNGRRQVANMASSEINCQSCLPEANCQFSKFSSTTYKVLV